MGGSIELIGIGIMVFIMLLGIMSPFIIICILVYMKKRLEHKQILAAIEKGISPKDLNLQIPKQLQPPRWVKRISAGVAMIVFSIFLMTLDPWLFDLVGFDIFHFNVLPAAFFAIGVYLIISGILQRSAWKQLQTKDAPVTENPDP